MFKAAIQVVTTTVVLSGIAVFSVWAQQPWLVPSLGASAPVQIMMPREPAARPWNAAVGQLAGVAGGFAGVYLAGAAATPSFMDHHELMWARVLAVTIGIALITALQALARARNPAGAADRAGDGAGRRGRELGGRRAADLRHLPGHNGGRSGALADAEAGMISAACCENPFK